MDGVEENHKEYCTHQLQHSRWNELSQGVYDQTDHRPKTNFPSENRGSRYDTHPGASFFVKPGKTLII